MATLSRPSVEPWQLLSEEVLGHFSIFSLVRTERQSPTSSRRHSFLRLDAPDWVNVVAVTTDYRLILVRQYRHGTDTVTLEIPGGAVDAGEDPAGAALRELEEETGYVATELSLLGTVEPNPAFQSNTCFTFLARGCRAVGEPRPDPSEELEVELVEVDELGRLIDAGEITHALVVAAHDHLTRAVARGEPTVLNLTRRQHPPEAGPDTS